MKKILFCAVCIFLIVFCSCSVCAVSTMPLNHCIETANFYLYIPDQYIDLISFSVGDQILYFATTSTVNCLLIYKNSSSLYQCSFGNIYRANSTQYNYTNLSSYYNQAVSVSLNQTTSRISPITLHDIVYTDINFNSANRSDIFNYVIIILLFCPNLLSLFYIFSKKREK